jgi:hypothetical protein
MKRAIAFGGMAPPISEQLPELHAATAELFQQCANAITLLKIHQILTDGQVSRARVKLARQVANELSRHAADRREG